MFIFKKSKIVVDCFVTQEYIHKYFPIEKSTSFYPDWWQNMPTKFMRDGFIPHATMKTCSGFIELYKQGFMIPLWTDLAIQIDNRNYKWQFADGNSVASVHDGREWESYVDRNQYGHLKIHSPWKIKTKEDIKWYYTNPFYNYKPKREFTILPGVVNYKTQNSTHVNLFLHLGQSNNILLDAGEPIAHVIPFTEKEIIYKNHVVSKEEYDKIGLVGFKFIRSYNFNKCPFHKG